MSIYPEQRNGRPTGFWKVEVTVYGQRHIARTKSHDDALRIEHELKLTGRKPDSNCVQIYTLGQLNEDCGHKLWLNQKDGDYALKRWRRCLAILGPQTPVSEVRFARLERLSERLRDEGLHPKTVNRHLACVSKALRWAWKRDIILAMPPVPRLPEDEGRIAFLRPKEVPEFLAYLYEYERPTTALCLELLLITGMRAGELMTLAPRDVEIEDTEALIKLRSEKTKTGYSRVIPIPREMGERLLALVMDKLPDYDLLLRACHRASEEIGTKDIITPHVLRHTCATLLSASGTPSLTVADLLGHRNLATTRKYVHPSREALREATRSMSLRGNDGTARGKSSDSLSENSMKSEETSGFLDLQSAPFAARDIPPQSEKSLEKPKVAVKRKRPPKCR